MTTPQATFLPLSSLTVPPDRQRQEFEPVSILELAKSIETHGLFHAIQVRQDGHTLVTGERRLRAIREHLIPLGKSFMYAGDNVPPGTVPVIRVSTADPLSVEEIELQENTVRKDLSWAEQAKTTARLHALRQAQVEQRIRNGESTMEAGPYGWVSESHTVADTSREVRGSAEGWYGQQTRNEIIVAKHLDNPEVAAASSLKDAFKILVKQEEARRVTALGAEVGRTFSSAAHNVHHTNCLEWMEAFIQNPTMMEGAFDVILTDPPYGMGAHEFGDGAGRLTGIEHSYDDSYESWLVLMDRWTTLSYQITKPQAHAYVFCDFDRFHELKRLMERAGWYVFRTPLINYKRSSGRVPLPDMGPRRQYELCLYAIKGKKQTRAIYSDVIISESDEQLSHGAQKPVGLYLDLLRRSVVPGDRVLDSFAGTGTILPACHEFSCRATALEQSPTYYGLCLERLAALGVQGEIPL